MALFGPSPEVAARRALVRATVERVGDEAYAVQQHCEALSGLTAGLGRVLYGPSGGPRAAALAAAAAEVCQRASRLVADAQAQGDPRRVRARDLDDVAGRYGTLLEQLTATSVELQSQMEDIQRVHQAPAEVADLLGRVDEATTQARQLCVAAKQSGAQTSRWQLRVDGFANDRLVAARTRDAGDPVAARQDLQVLLQSARELVAEVEEVPRARADTLADLNAAMGEMEQVRGFARKAIDAWTSSGTQDRADVASPAEAGPAFAAATAALGAASDAASDGDLARCADLVAQGRAELVRAQETLQRSLDSAAPVAGSAPLDAAPTAAGAAEVPAAAAVADQPVDADEASLYEAAVAHLEDGTPAQEAPCAKVGNGGAGRGYVPRHFAAGAHLDADDEDLERDADGSGSTAQP